MYSHTKWCLSLAEANSDNVPYIEVKFFIINYLERKIFAHSNKFKLKCYLFTETALLCKWLVAHLRQCGLFGWQSNFHPAPNKVTVHNKSLCVNLGKGHFFLKNTRQTGCNNTKQSNNAVTKEIGSGAYFEKSSMVISALIPPQLLCPITITFFTCGPRCHTHSQTKDAYGLIE